MLFSSVILGGIGGGLWWAAYKRFRRWRTYARSRQARAHGSSQLRLETAPVPLGKSTRARLEMDIPADEQPRDGFRVRVVCRVSRGTTLSYTVLWEDSTSASGPSGPGETNVPLLIDLPAAVPQNRSSLSSGIWKIEVTASFDDKPDYEATFHLPVRVPYDHDERVADDAAADGSISSPESVDLDPETAPADASDEETVSSDGDDDGKGTVLRRAASEPESGADEEESFSEPVSTGIQMDGRPGEGLTFTFDRARPPERSSGYKRAVWGTLLTGVGVMMLADWELGCSFLFGLLSVVIGGLVLPRGWRILTDASRIEVANGQVEVQKGPFFLDSAPTRVSCKEVEDAEVRAGSGNQSIYTLSLTKKGTDSSIPVAEGLVNKDEAEWIADQIRQAVEQQAAST